MAQTKAGALIAAARNAGITVDTYVRMVGNGLKRCSKCKTWKETANFGKDSTRHGGRDAKCLPCRHVSIRAPTKGRPSPFKGRVHSAQTRAKMSESAKNHPSNRVGKKHTLETRAKISAITRERVKRGTDAPGYIDGKGAERYGLRMSAELKRWRYDVYLRDEFSCSHCGDDRGGNLNAHHILPFATYPNHRFDIRNGITLCEPCHQLAHQVQLWGYPQPAG